MKRLLLGLAGASLFATSALAYPSYIDSFFSANYNVPNLAEYARRQVGQVSYLLAEWNDYDNVGQRYVDGGYVKLGESYWEENGGVPYKEAAIDYARFIGADAVVYVTRPTGKFSPMYGIERCDHRIGFYARKSTGGARLSFSAPSGSRPAGWDDNPRSWDSLSYEEQQAERGLQAAWDRLPAAKKRVLRAAQREWIAIKDAARDPQNRIQMILARTTYLAGQ